MSDLRTRIAATLDGHVASWNYDCCPDGEKHVGEWSQHVADVLIRELGMTVEWDGDNPYDPGPRWRHRYVTEWTTDE